MLSTHDDDRWDAVRERRAGAGFIFAVRTTRVACRPGCPARTPARRNVRFFDDFAAAAAAGFRACKRCAPHADPDGERRALIARACALLDLADPPALAQVAAQVGWSRYHFQRVFRAATGMTPGGYLRARRDQRFRARLRAGDPVTRAVHEAGYGSAAGAYARELGMTPRAYRDGAPGERISFAVAACSLGCVLAAVTARGVCAIELGDDEAAVLAALARHFPRARRERDQSGLRETLDAVLALIEEPARAHALPLDLRGTAFQQRVWQALRALPPGAPSSYAAVARAVGAAGAARAVGAACAANRLAVAIPCHRVVRGDGAAGGYRWGPQRKRALLARESRP